MSPSETRSSAKSDPSTDTKAPAPGEWQRLRSLLLGAEQASLKALAAKVGNRDNLARSVASVLSEAAALRARQDDSITHVLAPIVNEGLQQSVRRNPQPLVDALYPIMGPAIRRSITEALAEMMQAFNRAVEQSLSPRAIKWRFDAWRTGQPYSNVVLLNTLLYRVEQLFLIHRESGLLLGHVQAEQVVVQDPDMVSAMLTAIRDFVDDSFHVSHEDGVDAIRLGDLSVQVRVGPKAVLAAVVRGSAPESLGVRLSETLEGIHASHAVALSRFEGNPELFADTIQELRRCLSAQVRNHSHVAWRAYLVFGLIAMLVGGWAFTRYQTTVGWNAILDELEHEPGFVIVESGRGGSRSVHGLRDPLARDPRDVIGAVRTRKYGVTWDLKPYLSTEPQFVLSRARLLLRPPHDVTLRLDGSTLHASGVASGFWLREARNRAPFVPGVTAFDDSSIEVNDREALDRARQALSSAILYFDPGSDALSESQRAKLDALIPSLLALGDSAAASQSDYSVEIIGRADAPGTTALNLRLSQSRADAVRDYLAAHGAPAKHMRPRGIGTLDLESARHNEFDDSERRVNFSVVPIPTDHPAGSTP
jgi:outer membrane protein OmpA-like peptidoglycan-associated protein